MGAELQARNGKIPLCHRRIRDFDDQHVPDRLSKLGGRSLPAAQAQRETSEGEETGRGLLGSRRDHPHADPHPQAVHERGLVG